MLTTDKKVSEIVIPPAKNMGFLRNNKELQSGTYNHGKPQASPRKQRRGKIVLVAAVGRGGHFFFFLGKMKVK